MTTISLIIPSVGRPGALQRALLAAQRQDHHFDEIVVVARTNDDETAAAANASGVRTVTVSEPGVLAAMSAGARATTSDLIAFSDDDAELERHWCTRVLSVFDEAANVRLGGYGGRDVIYDDGRARPTTLTTSIGLVRSFGRVTGNHHRGTGDHHRVAMLKGVNCAYRRAAFAVPQGLRGDGAQAHFEVAIGQHLLRAGWRLRYDASLTVLHSPAPRLGEDQRQRPSDSAIYDSAFNLMRALAPTRQHVRWLYVHLVGDRNCPGVLRCLIALGSPDRSKIWARRRPSWRATTDAWRLRRETLSFETFS